VDTTQETGATLAEEIASIEMWYHTLELAPGVVTPGWHDTRPIVERIPFPATLAGNRCLDVGTFDGFWAFEMERRGAREVLAIDVIDPAQWDWPVLSAPETIAAIGGAKSGGRGFEIAKRELGSSVERLERNIYDLDEAEVGRFDLVYVGSLLVHLRDPVRALERVRSVCDGTLIVMDGIDLPLSTLMPRRPVARLDGMGRPWWWYPNVAGLRRMVEAGGFEIVRPPSRFFMPPGKRQSLVGRLQVRLAGSREGRRALTIAWKGDPHAVLAARPRTA